MKKCSREVLSFFSEMNETHWKNRSQSLVGPLFNFTPASSLHKYTAWRTKHRLDGVDIRDLHDHQGFIVLRLNKFATNQTPS